MTALRVYSFEHWDCGIETYAPADSTLENARVAAAFRAAGWDGHGVIQIIDLPPFCFRDAGNESRQVFHVKGRRNGASWIGSFAELVCSAVFEGTIDLSTFLPEGGAS